MSATAVPVAGPATFGYRRLLLTYLAPQRRGVGLLALLLAVTIALQLAAPQVLRRFIDQAAVSAPTAMLVPTALLFLGAALALQLAQLGEVHAAETVGLAATNRLRADLAGHLLGLGPAFHARHTPGELVERVDGDVSRLGDFFARLVVHLVGNALLLAGVLLLLATVEWRLAAVVAASSALGLGCILGLRRPIAARTAAARQSSAELFGLVEERLGGTEDVRPNGGGAYVLRRFLERTRAHVWAGVRARLATVLAYEGAGLWLHLGTVAALGVAAALFLRGELTIGTVYLVFAYSESLRGPVEAIARQLQGFAGATASIERVRGLLAERSPVVDPTSPAPVPVGPLGVEFDRVTFGYGGESVLRDVSFRLAPGQVLGLLGRSGSGKTTIARLLFRLYDPAAGAVRVAGVGMAPVDLRALGVAALRARVALVTQDVQLFHASVRDNTTLFDDAVPDERVAAVLENVGLGPWLRRQPEGLHTRLAPGGLSAGEAQLLAFARAFLQDPGLVILDEASSRLDPATERLVERAVDDLLGGRTAIVVAHRLSTLTRADRVLLLEDGQLIEEGERAALAADPASRFYRLLRAGAGEVLE